MNMKLFEIILVQLSSGVLAVYLVKVLVLHE